MQVIKGSSDESETHRRVVGETLLLVVVFLIAVFLFWVTIHFIATRVIATREATYELQNRPRGLILG